MHLVGMRFATVPRHLRTNCARLFSSNIDPELIILNPRQAGIVKSKPRKPKRHNLATSKESSPRGERNSLINHNISPLTPPISANSKKTMTLSSIVEALQSQKPETNGITQSRFDQIKEDIVRGFNKPHLDEYLKLESDIPPSKYRSLNKSAKAHMIMTQIWKCFVRKDDSRLTSGVFVENIIELNEQEFVLVLGNNGILLREWTKSGAKISIWPARCQIIVNSSQKTFDWIEAMLSQFLESITITEVNLTGIKKYVNPTDFPEHLAAIQQLTSTYFSGLTEDAESFMVYSGGKTRNANTEIAKRLLLQLAGSALTKKWKPQEWWYDTISRNYDSCHFHPFDENDSIEWLDRLRKWSRWQAVKTRNTLQNEHLPDIRLKQLEQPSFGEASIDDESVPINAQLEGIAQALLKKFPAPALDDMSTTLTITPGYVTHEVAEEKLPNAGMLKSFCSNIPYVSKVASALPMYADDTLHAENDISALKIDMSHDKPEEVTATPDPEDAEDIWKKIMNLDVSQEKEENSDGVFVNRYKDLNLPSNLRLIQMKFVPHPSHPSANEFPPVEAWAELPPAPVTPGPQQLEQIPRILAVPMEASSFVSLPHHPADLKITVAHSYPLPATPELEEYFMRKCKFDRMRPRYVPAELTMDIQGQKVTYLYYGAAYITLADLQLQNNLLQLSQAEGGKLSGRKVEVNVVQHSLSKDFDSAKATSESVKAAMAFSAMM